ncbi:MAG: hemerythrin domain-containing protein [Desulfobacterales bacterium]
MEKIADPLSVTRKGLSEAAEPSSRVVEKTSENDVFRLVTAEAEKVMKLFKKLRDTSAHEEYKRVSLLKESEDRILFLNRREEEYLYPVTEIITEGNELLFQSMQENKSIESLLAELEKAPKDGPDFEYKVEALISEVSAHVEREKKELFPKLNAAIPEAEAAMLGEQFSRRR